MPKKVYYSRKVRYKALQFIDDEAVESETGGDDSNSELSSSINQERGNELMSEKAELNEGDDMSDQESCHIYYGSDDNKNDVTPKRLLSLKTSTKRTLRDNDDDDYIKPKAKKKRYQLSDTESDDESNITKKDITREDDNDFQATEDDCTIHVKKEKGGDVPNGEENNAKQGNNETAETSFQSTPFRGVATTTKPIIFNAAHDTEGIDDTSQNNTDLTGRKLRVLNPYLGTKSDKDRHSEDFGSDKKPDHKTNSELGENWDDPNEELSDELLQKMKLAEADYERRKKMTEQRE